MPMLSNVPSKKKKNYSMQLTISIQRYELPWKSFKSPEDFIFLFYLFMYLYIIISFFKKERQKAADVDPSLYL